MHILVVDDDAVIRMLTTTALKKWGHEVVTAQDGVEAMELLAARKISFVISDWMMPRMDGLELCNRIRSTVRSHYVYIILLTAKGETNEIVKGMQAGADDFITKPFHPDELKARIRAGERVLNLERHLAERNSKLDEAYSVIRKDLDAAARMQKSLLPSAAASMVSGVKFDWLFLPCAFLAGDLFNFFSLDESQVGFYLLDVAGHGIPSAMLSVSLGKMLSPLPIQSSILKHYVSTPPHYAITPPATVMQELNNRYQDENDAMQYFTIVYGLIDTQRCKLRLCQAGHPSPIVLKAGAKSLLVGTDGFPVGMLPDVKYEEVEFDFHPGDRLFVYSDGITECANKNGEQFSVARLMRHLEDWRDLPLRELLGLLDHHLHLWRGESAYEDDVTILAVEQQYPQCEFRVAPQIDGRQESGVSCR
jgi:sigma-B regulation protein RsbU (phosphoserine phosphatase)